MEPERDMMGEDAIIDAAKIDGGRLGREQGGESPIDVDRDAQRARKQVHAAERQDAERLAAMDEKAGGG